jgi:hypothetical protein
MGSCLNVCTEIFKKEMEIHTNYIKEKYYSPKKKNESVEVNIEEKPFQGVEKNTHSTFKKLLIYK